MQPCACPDMQAERASFSSANSAKFRYPTRTDLSWPFLNWDTECDDPCSEIKRALHWMAVAEALNPSILGEKHILCCGTDSETRWLFRADFQLLLISIRIH